MKKANKIFSIVLAVVLVLAMAVPAFAANPAWTGNITINSSTNVSVNDKVFKAYKILDAEAVDATDLTKGVVYTIPTSLQAFFNELCGGADSVATADEVKDYLGADDFDLYDFAAKALEAAKAASIVPATATGADDKATFTDLKFGYYVIEDEGTATPISALMLKTTSVEMEIKADKPTLEKKIDGENDGDDTTAGLVDYNTATVGEDVPYVLTSKVPVMEGYASYTYTVTDTFSTGLDFNNDVDVTIGGETYTAYEVLENGQEVTIAFTDFINLAEKAGSEIKITYSAKVTSDAKFGSEGNPNTAYLTYSNNPQVVESTETTTEDVVYTYLIGLVVNKVDGEGAPLAGATFNVEHDGTVIATGTSGKDGVVAFTWTAKGLKDGETYTIIEIAAPDGYNEAADITFTVTCTDPTAPATACVWSVNNEKVSLSTDGYVFETTIENLTGSLLPETGGIGTTIFYIVGGLLVAGAVILLITKRRMSAQA